MKDETKALIAEKMAGNFGLDPMRWRNQLEEIRRLPETGEK
jgi:hypothetical protein